MPGEWGVAGICCRRGNGLTLRGTKAIIASAPSYRARRDCKLDDKLNTMLRDLRRALSEAISESSEINRTLRKIREEGYSLYLLVDCKREVEDAEALSLTGPRWPTSGEPAFQIDGRDLNFLKSIGIDPTRRLRRRRVS
jgi:hypothetical protein